MKVCCVWGNTRQDVEVAYGLLAEQKNPPQRVTWRLTAQFDGTPVGDECFAPFNPEIQEAYGGKPASKSKKAKSKGAKDGTGSEAGEGDN